MALVRERTILKFILRMKLYMFRTVPLSIVRSFSLYTQQWYMSYRQLSSSRIRMQRMFHPDPALYTYIYIYIYIVYIHTHTHTSVTRIRNWRQVTDRRADGQVYRHNLHITVLLYLTIPIFLFICL
jgi:nitrogen fixation/metabolism regulation signal transduction histidine kinase